MCAKMTDLSALLCQATKEGGHVRKRNAQHSQGVVPCEKLQLVQIRRVLVSVLLGPWLVID